MYQKDPLTWENVIEVILRDYPTTKKSEDGKSSGKTAQPAFQRPEAEGRDGARPCPDAERVPDGRAPGAP